MKARMGVLASAILFFCLSLLSGEELEKKQEEGKKQGEFPSFIRKDLLVRPERRLQPPRRNIFMPSRSSPVEEDPGYAGQKINLGRSGLDIQDKEEKQAGPVLNLRYLGYVQSAGKLVALIVFEGQLLAVEKGEMISEGVKVGEISPEEIEIIGPDSLSRKFSLEGVKP